MSHYILYIVLHFLACVLYFVVLQRPAFFSINKKMSETPVSGQDLRKASSVGLKTDFAGAAYLTGLPLLTLWVCAYCGLHSVKLPLLIADGIVALALSLITVADTILYSYWRFRIDVSVLTYLRSIKSALASVTTGYAVLAFAVVLSLAGAIFAAFYGIGILSGVFAATVSVHSPWQILGITGAMLLAAGVMFACIRGIKHRPNSPYQLYYSSNMYLNHTAVNPVFNMAYSASIKSKESKKFKIFDTQECNATVSEMLPTQGVTQEQLLTTKRPNILVIVWESLSAYFTERLGEKSGVTPNLDRLSSEGVLFTHVDAGSWRTDPAMVCILSGYPGQPTTSIMRDTHKLPALPALPRSLKAEGYHTSMLHGGSLSYMHMIDYYMAAGFDDIRGEESVAAEAPRCAWGVHDEYMFDRLYEQLLEQEKTAKPWFTTFLTLSSHQPYIVPMHKLDDQIDNSYAYTDDALGRFIEKLKKSPVWDDTLIVVMGDHGINISFLPMPRHKQPRIPLVLLGGAVKEAKEVDTIMSQTDFAATLLGQLGIGHSDYRFSRDVLADTYKYPFAINIYNNGFLYRDGTGYTEYDNVAERAVDSPDSERERRGRMFMQYMMDDLDALASNNPANNHRNASEK